MSATGAMGVLWQIGAFIAALGILVVIHELGHFLVARGCGVKVMRFAVGFGKPLLSRQFGSDGTELTLGAIPLGGYVKMLDEREGPVAPHELPRAFNRQSVGKRMLIVVAGPAANLFLAVVLYWLVFQTGVSEMRSYVGQAPAGTVAAALNVSAGERVVRLDGRAIDVWSEFRLTLVDAALAGHPVKLETVTAEGTPVERMIEFGRGVADHLDGDLAGYLGFVPYAPPLRPVVGSIVDGSAAQAGGLKVGDTVAEIDGTAIAWWSQVVDCVKASPGKSLTVTIARDGQRKVLHIVPAGVEQGGIRIGRIGAGVRLDPSVDNRFRVEVRYGAVDALGRSLQQTWDMARLTLVVMARMVTGEVSIRNISGPVAIADYAGQSARIGPSAFARFLALVSVSLGVLNLLPIPILDGGHLMYYLAEFFKGSPLAERTLEIGQRIGIALLGLLMALALYNDFNRLISG